MCTIRTRYGIDIMFTPVNRIQILIINTFRDCVDPGNIALRIRTYVRTYDIYFVVRVLPCSTAVITYLPGTWYIIARASEVSHMPLAKMGFENKITRAAEVPEVSFFIFSNYTCRYI